MSTRTNYVVIIVVVDGGMAIVSVTSDKTSFLFTLKSRTRSQISSKKLFSSSHPAKSNYSSYTLFLKDPSKSKFLHSASLTIIRPQ